MSKNTKTTTAETTKFEADLAALKTARKELQKKFRIDVQKLYDDYRAEVKALRTKKNELWAARKAETKAAKEKRAAEKAAAKAAEKPTKKVTKKLEKLDAPAGALKKAAAKPEVKGVKSVKAARKTTKRTK